VVLDRGAVADGPCQHRIVEGREEPEGDCLTQNEAMEYLGISKNALLALVRRGVLSSNQITDFAPWRIPREQLDSKPVQRLVKTLKESGRLPKGGSPDSHPRLFHDQ
jgi:hypothetical protein